MDVNYLVVKCIANHLPRKIRYIYTNEPLFYESRRLTYTRDTRGRVVAVVKLIPLDIIKTLRLTHSSFAGIFDVFALCRKGHVDLFRSQYSAIMLRNHVFDMRWAAFPADTDSSIYDEWKSHVITHRVMLTYQRRPTVCRYCDEEYQHYLDKWRARTKLQASYAPISTGIDYKDWYFRKLTEYSPFNMFQNISKRRITIDLGSVSHLIPSNIPTPYYNPIKLQQVTSRAVRTSPHIQIPDGERVGMTKGLTSGIDRARRATAADLGIPTRRQAKRDKHKR